MLLVDLAQIHVHVVKDLLRRHVEHGERLLHVNDFAALAEQELAEDTQLCSIKVRVPVHDSRRIVCEARQLEFFEEL